MYRLFDILPPRAERNSLLITPQIDPKNRDYPFSVKFAIDSVEWLEQISAAADAAGLKVSRIQLDGPRNDNLEYYYIVVSSKRGWAGKDKIEKFLIDNGFAAEATFINEANGSAGAPSLRNTLNIR